MGRTRYQATIMRWLWLNATPALDPHPFSCTTGPLRFCDVRSTEYVRRRDHCLIRSNLRDDCASAGCRAAHSTIAGSFRKQVPCPAHAPDLRFRVPAGFHPRHCRKQEQEDLNALCHPQPHVDVRMVPRRCEGVKLVNDVRPHRTGRNIWLTWCNLLGGMQVQCLFAAGSGRNEMLCFRTEADSCAFAVATRTYRR